MVLRTVVGGASPRPSRGDGGPRRRPMAAAGGAPSTVTALLLGGRRGPAPPLSGARCGPAPAPGCLPRAMGEQWGGEWSRAPPRRGGRGRSARWPPRPCPLAVCCRPELYRGREEVGRPAREGLRPPLPAEGAGRVRRGGAARRRREQGWGGASREKEGLEERPVGEIEIEYDTWVPLVLVDIEDEI